MIFDSILQSRKHRTNADLKVAISQKKPFSSVMRYIVLWRHLWRYPINANMKTWYPQKPHIMTFTLIPSSFFSDHCVKLYGWMCITFQMPLVYYFQLFSLSVCLLSSSIIVVTFLVTSYSGCIFHSWSPFNMLKEHAHFSDFIGEGENNSVS